VIAALIGQVEACAARGRLGFAEGFGCDRFVVGDRDEGLARLPVRLLPQALHDRCLEQLVDGLVEIVTG
jgi:hypothetical protein